MVDSGSKDDTVGDILIYVMCKTVKGFVLFLIGGKYLSCSPVIHVHFVLKGNVSHITC